MPLSINTVTSTYKLNYYITGLVRFVQGLCAVRNFSELIGNRCYC